MDPNDSMSTTTNFSQISANLESFIKKEEITEDDVKELDLVLNQLNTGFSLSQDLETAEPMTNENIHEKKAIYFFQLSEQVKQYQMKSPPTFKRILQIYERSLRKRIEMDSATIEIIRNKRDKMKNELNRYENLIQILKEIQSKIVAKANEKQQIFNRIKVEEEIDRKHRECKQDLIYIMKELYPNDSNITSMLQELFRAHKRGGSSSYIQIIDPDSPLVYALKSACIIECDPTDPTKIKFTIF